MAAPHAVHSLGMAMCFDRLNVTNGASCELQAQRLLMVERAVRVTAKAPSFVGFHRMIDNSLEEGGGDAAREYTAHVARLAQEEARIL